MVRLRIFPVVLVFANLSDSVAPLNVFVLNLWKATESALTAFRNGRMMTPAKSRSFLLLRNGCEGAR